MESKGRQDRDMILILCKHADANYMIPTCFLGEVYTVYIYMCLST